MRARFLSGDEAATDSLIAQRIVRIESVMVQLNHGCCRDDNEGRNEGTGALADVCVLESVCLALSGESSHGFAWGVALAGGNPWLGTVGDRRCCACGRGAGVALLGAVRGDVTAGVDQEYI